jgi:MFS superfamily sulfate permease-like transporter
MDTGLVVGIAIGFAVAVVAFLVGFIFGAGVVVNRVRDFRDWLRVQPYPEGNGIALVTMGNLISYLEGSIKVERER